MSDKQMWMATRDHGDWVPCANSGADFSSVGYASTTQYLNGGAYVRRSRTTHREYELAWPLLPRDALRPIDDIAKGLWGDGLIYFLDPFAMDKNALPPHWAAPMLSAGDAPPLVGETPPVLSVTPANSLGYPIRTATYSGVDMDAQTLYVPIPRGYKAWIGVHGPANVGKMVVRGVISATNKTPNTVLPTLAVTDATRFTNSFSGDTYMGIEVSVEGDVSYAGAMLQILPSDVIPDTGGFISGQGNSGGDFEAQPRLQVYSSALDKVGMTAKLIETGSWL
jgi:hypothetical protein